MTGSEQVRAALTAGSPYPTLAEDRVRSDAADPEDACPYIVFRRIAVDREFGLDNTLLAMTETFQIFCWGSTPAEAQQLEAETVGALLAVDLVPGPNDPDDVNFDVGDNVVVLTVDVVTTPQIT